MHTWIRAASTSVAGVIRGALIADPVLGQQFDPGQGGLMRVTLHTPQEMAEQNLDGLSVFLYHIGVDEQSRNRPPERIAPDRVRPVPLPLKLRFLFTPVVANLDPETSPEFEQDIIGKVIETWHSRPFLAGGDLSLPFQGSDTRLAIRIEPLDLESISRIWDALEESFQLSISYELTLVEIWSREHDVEGPSVENIWTPGGPVVAGAAP